MPRTFLARLARTWLVVALWDAACASALAIVAYGSTATRLWQGVASTVLGPAAMDGGARAVAVGLLLHAAVALAWSLVFLALVERSPRLARVIESPRGVLATAALYGPAIWLVMSLLVIPAATGRMPTFGVRWWVQLCAHIPFVTLPLVAMAAWTARPRAATGSTPLAAPDAA